MATFAQFVYLLSLVLWIGAIAFFSFFTAPVMFRMLDQAQAGKVVSALFPRYYKLQYICGVLALASLAMVQHAGFNPNWLFLALMLACAVYAGQVISPQAQRVKEEINTAGLTETLEAKFQSLHAWSVKLNSAVLVMGLGTLWITALHLTF